MITSSSEPVRSERNAAQNGGTSIDLDTEIEVVRRNLAELDRQREHAAARLMELERIRGSRSSERGGGNEWSSAAKL